MGIPTAMKDLSCHRFRSNEVRLWLSVIAYNLGNLWRRLLLPQRIGNWSLTSLQQRLVKTGGRLIKHARYYRLLLAESHLTRRLFGSMVGGSLRCRCRRPRERWRQRTIWRGKETATERSRQNWSRRPESWVPRFHGRSGTGPLGAG